MEHKKEIYIEQSAAEAVEHKPYFDYFSPVDQCVVSHFVRVFLTDEETSEGKVNIGFIKITEYKNNDIHQASGSLKKEVAKNKMANPHIAEMAQMDPDEIEDLGVPSPFEMVADKLLNIDVAFIEPDYRGHGYGSTAIDAALRLLGSQSSIATIQPKAFEASTFEQASMLDSDSKTMDSDDVIDKLIARFRSIGFVQIKEFGGVMTRNCCFMPHMSKRR